MMRRVVVALASGLPLAFAVFLTGCNGMMKSQVSSSTSLPVVEPTPVITPKTRNVVPRELKLKLTLDDPADLKVKLGDSVSKGQVISDRTSARKPLEQQRQAIRLKSEHLNANAGASSKPVSDAVEQAKVRQARVKVWQARAAIALFKTHSPWTDYAWASLPLSKESAQVSQLEAKVQETEAELNLAVAQLQAAREKNLASQDTSLQQVLLMSQLRDIEARLDGVGVVRSPYDGSIKSIKWLGQREQILEVELKFAVAAPSMAK
jgi:multidrug efflux pump subunit AcrA (membrane-fusion protein)